MARLLPYSLQSLGTATQLTAPTYSGKNQTHITPDSVNDLSSSGGIRYSPLSAMCNITPPLRAHQNPDCSVTDHHRQPRLPIASQKPPRLRCTAGLLQNGRAQEAITNGYRHCCCGTLCGRALGVRHVCLCCDQLLTKPKTVDLRRNTGMVEEARRPKEMAETEPGDSDVVRMMMARDYSGIQQRF